ncbi:hypothetical protein DFH08DRAFT_899192 [Mycena albidolilacea]|uniref:Extracellular membrane protein CFEM domain-containing protein n=1 Tax=Mycena albidolilacea TaxID=1033008 RepID=A0AAD6Z6Y9_9AGAR|nr:hypothetical protein DFH08DRAFT_899192 [Mycena albidolilacea]
MRPGTFVTVLAVALCVQAMTPQSPSRSRSSPPKDANLDCTVDCLLQAAAQYCGEDARPDLCFCGNVEVQNATLSCVQETCGASTTVLDLENDFCQWG